jgi:CDP-diacylglycerol--serine O-phosphatidyltransferase
MVFQPLDPVPPRRRRFKAIPVRILLPNLITLLALCAGLTAIRMAVENNLQLALAAIVFAALLDGIDGRVARLLKASSRFGAELDSLADFVNFGVAPAFLVFNWGLGDLKSLGWICVMIFALASALRLARFNVAMEEERPKWQADYFVGMPTPAAAIVVLLPIFIERLGFDFRSSPITLNLVLVYTLLMAFMMVSTIPTYSGKLLGERISREYVLPIFMLAVGFVALLVTYPFATLTGGSLIYLALVPVSWRRFTQAMQQPQAPADAAGEEQGRIVAIRSGDPPR